MTKYPTWVLEPSDSELTEFFGPQTLLRGRGYADESRVRVIMTSEKIVTAQVRGSGHRAYRTTVVNGREGEFSTVCTCPVGHACKHGAAVFYDARLTLGPLDVPDWRRRIDPMIAVVDSPNTGAPLALQFHPSPMGTGLVPLRQGAHRWAKSGATWRELLVPDAGINEQQRHVVAAIHATHRSRGYLNHGGDMLGLREMEPAFWQWLRRAREVGIDLLAGGPTSPGGDAPEPVLLDEPAEPTLVVHPHAEGLELQPSVRVGDEEVKLSFNDLVGTPAHGISALHKGQLLLAPLSRPLTEEEQELFSSPASQIPASDTSLFATGYLPRLRRRIDVVVAPGVMLPEPALPKLRCMVAFDGHAAEVTWGFRYELGAEVHNLTVLATKGEPPVRNPEAEDLLANAVPAGPWRPTDEGAGALAGVHITGRDLIAFTSDVLPLLEANPDVVVELNEDAPEFREASEAPQINLEVEDSTTGDWFDLQVEVNIDDELVPFGPLLGALASGQDHMILPSGTWFSLDAPELDRLRILIDEARELVEHEGDVFHLRPEHAGLWEELVELGVVARQSANWRESVGALLNHTELAKVDPPSGLRADLRSYQQEGQAWLRFLWRTRIGGILADEMGLGKTLQSLALAQAAFEAGELTNPMLVVAPTSVISTWASEAARFTPELGVVVVSETGRRRGRDLGQEIEGAHIVLTSYTLLRLDADDYVSRDWAAVLLDEAQFVKNPSSKVYQAVRRLRARVKVALTGTPLENNLMDLWALLSITAPGLFPDPKRFTEAYRKPIEGGDSDALARLHRRIKPLILRRTKAAVAKELPDKQEQVVSVPLTPAHRRLYDRHLTRERQKVLGLVGDMSRNRITILRSLTLLRQLSLAPSLVDAEYPEGSAKIDALMELLEEVTAAGHRALVFSQFTGFLGLVQERFDADGVTYEYLDGRTKDRADRISAFREGDASVFLISLKAGGFGLTLTEADYVFILDPWWNPASENQAIDRTHRIGQVNPVNVYRLVSADTIEEKVVALQERKRDLFDAVVGTASDVAAPLSADDVRGLLEDD